MRACTAMTAEWPCYELLLHYWHWCTTWCCNGIMRGPTLPDIQRAKQGLRLPISFRSLPPAA